MKDKSSCSHIQQESVLQRRHIEFHYGVQLKDKRQWLEPETRETLTAHWKIFIYIGMAKTLEQDDQTGHGTAIHGDFQTTTGLNILTWI